MKDDERPAPPYAGDERSTLAGFLDFQRATLEWKCDGLSDEQLRRRSLPTSAMSLLGHLRSEQPDTPVIVVSGIGDREHAEGLMRLGAFDFILKPFSLEDVEQSVARALEKSRARKPRRR